MSRSDVVVLAVKPDIVPTVLREIEPHIRQDALIVSIAAGIPLEILEEASCRSWWPCWWSAFADMVALVAVFCGGGGGGGGRILVADGDGVGAGASVDVGAKHLAVLALMGGISKIWTAPLFPRRIDVRLAQPTLPGSWSTGPRFFFVRGAGGAACCICDRARVSVGPPRPFFRPCVFFFVSFSQRESPVTDAEGRPAVVCMEI